MNTSEESYREKHHLDILYPNLGECTLFLKRDISFPLSKPCNIVTYGRGVRHTIKGGFGSGDVNTRFFTSIEEGLEKAGFNIVNKSQLDEIDIQYKQKHKEWVKRIKTEARDEHLPPQIYAIGKIMPEAEYDLEINKNGDAAIYVISRYSGEGSDREFIKGDILLTDFEIKCIKELEKCYEHFMVVINAGGYVDLSPIKEIRNILLLSELGSQIGDVFSDILLGKINPSGKLSATWAEIDKYPYPKEISLDDTYYNEGIYVGYRYFDSFNVEAMFPFGYGKSYTEFRLDKFNVKQNGKIFSVDLDVTNIGNYKGKEVVQVYICPLLEKLNTPFKELIGFKKTNLIEPYKSEHMMLEFELDYISKFNEDKCIYYIPKGDYLIMVGNSSDNVKTVASINVDEDIVLKKCKKIYHHIEINELRHVNAIKKPLNIIELTLNQKNFDIYEGVEMHLDIPDEIKKMSDEELATINNGYVSEEGGVFFVGESSISAPGAAGELSKLFTKTFNKNVVMADGPAGLRLTSRYYKKKNKIIKLEYNDILVGALEFYPQPKKWLLKHKLLKKIDTDKIDKIYYQYCTALPIATAIAQSYNLDFAYLCGDIVGTEMEEFNIDLWLAPGMNIQRTIMCGRNFEYFSEDPFLTGKMASSISQGVQSHKGKGVTVKHFSANNQETRRTTSNSVVSEKALREIYLRGFEIVFNEAKPKAVMTSYNLINGTHSSETYELIHDFIFVENSFEGIVMTDWVFRDGSAKNTKYQIMDSPNIYKTHTSLVMPGSQYHIDAIIKDVKEHPEYRTILEKNAARLYKNFVKNK